MQAFLEQLSLLGFNPPSIVLDGKLNRFPHDGSKDAGWMIGWQNHGVRDGKPYVYAQFGSWKTGEMHSHQPENMPKADQKAIGELMVAAKKKLEQEKKALQLEAAEKAARRFPMSAETGTTPYLERKRIDQLYGARVYQDLLQVPMRDAKGKIWGIQYIQPDGSKRFMKGQRIESLFHIIGKIKGEAIICEGFATGATLHQVTGKAVFVAFNAGNLINVARVVKEDYPDVELTVCGDDDRFTVVKGDLKNVGREKAKDAALVAQCAVLFPTFKSDEGKPTDFNDLFLREGAEAVRDHFKVDAEPECGFIPLGYDEGTYFYFEMRSKDIVRFSAFAKSNFFQLAPERFWDRRFPKNLDNATCNYDKATDFLIDTGRRIGPFDASKIRGVGVWEDRQKIIVNTGRSLVVGGIEKSFRSLKTSFTYVQSRNRMLPMHDYPLSVDECAPLIDACAMLHWQTPIAKFLLPGWLAIARVVGALPVRPHIWLTGSSATGKSTVMERIVKPSLGHHKNRIDAQGGTTEAGIRQALKASSVPVIFDEFESNDEHSRQRHLAIVELMRNSWSMSSGQVIKGSSHGVSSSYQTVFSALVASIGVTLITDADKSRFSVLELAKHSNDSDQWNRIDKAMKQIDEEFGERLFARIVGMIPTLLANYEVLRAAIARITRQRQGQQIGMLMAGFCCLIGDEVVDEALANEMAEFLNLREEDAERVEDESDCLNHLLTAHVRIDNVSSGGAETLSIEEIIRSPIKAYRDALRKYGVVVHKDSILVANNCWFLKKHYSNTRWMDWSKSLLRIPGAMKNGGIVFDKLQRCVKIPLDDIPDILDVPFK